MAGINQRAGDAMHPVLKVISGGQTGVDRAALDAALACGLPVAGWCPGGRRAEDGVIAARYPLIETPSIKYPQRTAWNVRDSDATLILTLRELDSGSKLTAEVAKRLGKPCLVVSLSSYPETVHLEELLPWTVDQAVLNVAGPRESRCPGIYPRAFGFLVRLFRGFEVASRRLKVASSRAVCQPPSPPSPTIGAAP
jgi:Circularly permutated YpsA SLOG family